MNIKELAEQAGYLPDMFGVGHWDSPEFKRFAELVAAAEREACAKLVEEVGKQTAAAIRARENNNG